jgi:hypothetical protein
MVKGNERKNNPGYYKLFTLRENFPKDEIERLPGEPMPLNSKFD